MEFELHGFEMQLGFLQSKTVLPCFAGSKEEREEWTQKADVGQQ